MTSNPRLTAHAAAATIGASTALSAVYADHGWLLPVVAAVGIVAVVNEVTRRSPVAASVGPVLSAAAVLCYLTAADASSTAYAGFLPTGSSLRALGDLARSGFDDVQALATPVPTHRGLVMLAVVAMAGVQLVVDLLAVTLRRAALAGLPLLAVFATCTSVARGGVGWMPFLLATTAYLWLLLVDSRDRIGRWGRTFGTDTASGARITWADVDGAPSPLSALGRRIGAAAIAVGVVVPMLVPGLHGGLPPRGGTGLGAGHGSSQVVTLNPIVNIRAEITSRVRKPLARVVTSDPSPGYLRLTSLDHFDGSTFSPRTLVAPASARVSGGIDAVLVPGTSVMSSVSVGRLSVHWLPVPAQLQRVDVDGDWRYDADTSTVFSARSDTRDLRYTVTSIHYEPAAAELDSAPAVTSGQMSRYLQVPEGPVFDRVAALAKALTAKARSPFRKALAIQDYLTSPPFIYDTDVAADAGTDALDGFLFTSKRGFCQQYATAMAVMTRLLGLPTRIAVGFTRGERQDDGSWLVTSHDAHAWPEIYFPGYGWLPFEPTPRSDGQTRPPAYTQSTKAGGTLDDAGPQPRASQPPDTPKKSNIDKKLDQHDVTGATPAPAARPRSRHSRGWLLGALLLLLLPVPALARVVSRRRRWAAADDATSQAHAAWAELRATALDAGVGWVDGTTPRAAARLVTADRVLPEPAAAALSRLVSAVERARYAAGPAAEPAAALRDDVTVVRRALTDGRSAWQHLGAVVWPRSTVRGMRRGVDRIADVLDLVDAAAARTTGWWRRSAQPPKPRPS